MVSRRSLWFPALAAGLALFGCRADTATMESGMSSSDVQEIRIGDIDWYVDYDAALEVAKAEDKPLWVHFGEDPG